MSDIFISYASADRDRAKMFADTLTAQGWSVWWDRIIPPGKEFDEVIEEALDAASCVVVLWSKASVASRWVKTESAEAMRRKVLVPALIDDAKIPLEFRRLQAADLSLWYGEPDHPELQNFLRSLESLVGRSGKAVPAGIGSGPRAHASSDQEKPVPPAHPSPPASNQARAPSRQGMARTVAIGVAALVVIVIGVTSYNAHRAQVEAKAQENAAAEQRRAADEERRKSEADRRAADDAIAQAKAAREEAVRDIARRKAEDETAAKMVRGRAAPAEQSRKSTADLVPDRAMGQLANDAPPSAINISGVWRDATGGVHQVRQSGNRFEFVTTNQSNGYYAQGSGTINGQHASTSFQTNLPSTGNGNWTIAADGQSIVGTVADSRLGQYGLTIYR